MAVEVLSDEQVEWEARRVAAAFGVEDWVELSSFLFESYAHYRGHLKDVTLEWAFLRTNLRLVFIRVGRLEDLGTSRCSELADGGHQGWLYAPHLDFDEVMARGLYRLGFEMSTLPRRNEDPFSQPEMVDLPPLTAHEKMELRLNFPGEFWPKQWHHEEEGS